MKVGADPNAQDGLQHTPFMMAAWFGKIDAAREIFEEVRREGGKEGGREEGREKGGVRGDWLAIALGGFQQPRDPLRMRRVPLLSSLLSFPTRRIGSDQRR